MGDSDEESAVTRRVVLGTGRGLDKRDRFETTKHVSTDWDLQKLSLLGPILWSVVLVVVIAGTAWYVFFSVEGLVGLVTGLVSELVGVSLPDVNAFARSRSLELVAGLAATSWLAPRVVASVRTELAGLRDSALAALYQIRHLGILLNPDTWSNHNYWHPFTSHLSDRDPLVILANADLDATIGGVFTDVPYYRNVFVDSVYVTFDALPDRATALELRWYDHRLARPRSFVIGAALLVLVVTRFPVGVVDTLPSLPWLVLELGAVYGLSGYIFVTAFTDYVGFRRRFFGNSAGFSEYGLLRSTDKTTLFEEDESVDRLGNSLFGYGLFYVSEFLWNVVSRDADYQVHNRVDVDDDGEARDRQLAGRAGTELLGRAVPTPDDDAEEPVSLSVNGVDYLRQDVRHRRLFGRVPVVGRRFGRRVGEGDERGLDTAGTQAGVRLPVKRFVSVPDPITADDNLETDARFPFYFDESWIDDEVHYLLMGGAEHQEALVKFIQYLRREAGYENVNLLENAFTEEEDLQFVSEYFVSSVLTGDDDFRSPADEDGSVFLVMRHRMDERRVVHLVYGMGALESKMAFLFWLDAFPEFGFDGDVEFEEDVLYRVRYDDIEADVGRLYADPSWVADQERSLTFEAEQATTLVEDGENVLPCRQVDVDVTYQGERE